MNADNKTAIVDGVRREFFVHALEKSGINVLHVNYNGRKSAMGYADIVTHAEKNQSAIITDKDAPYFRNRYVGPVVGVNGYEPVYTMLEKTRDATGWNIKIEYDNFIIAEQNIDKKLLKLLGKNGIDVIHVGKNGLKHNMTACEIVEFANTVGNPPIITTMKKRLDYDGIAIQVQDTESTHQMINNISRITGWEMKYRYS